MAWFSSAASAPKVLVDSKRFTNKFHIPGSSSSQNVEVDVYETRGLTEAAAITFRNSEHTAGNQPVMIPTGAGGWTVRTQEVTYGSWTVDT